MSDIREMPVKVLRGLFSGIGQLLLDRFRAQEAHRPASSQDESHGPPTGLDSEPAAHQMTTVDYVRSAAEAEAAEAKAAPAGREPAAAADLPVPGYDGLSLPSLRARLRYLDAKQLRILLEYEKSVSNRADIVTMFERRIAKIESGPDAS
jgi:hypothetical protein